MISRYVFRVMQDKIPPLYKLKKKNLTCKDFYHVNISQTFKECLLQNNDKNAHSSYCLIKMYMPKI